MYKLLLSSGRESRLLAYTICSVKKIFGNLFFRKLIVKLFPRFDDKFPSLQLNYFVKFYHDIDIVIVNNYSVHITSSSVLRIKSTGPL